MSTKGIRAGKAFVEVFADSARLTRDLRHISTKLKTFGASVTAIGLKTMAASAAAIVPMVGAMKHFSSFGDNVAKMAKRTGVGVGALSELQFVASQTGTEFGTLENAFRKMQRSIYDAGRGLSTQRDALADLNLRYEDLKDLSPEDQFMVLADRLGKVTDDTKQAGIAMSFFGRTGTNLIPMFEAGADGISRLREEARKLGLMMSDQDAKSAEDFTDAMDALGKSSKMSIFYIGAALAPAVQKVANSIQATVTSVDSWISENRGVVVSIAKIVAIVGVAGVGLVALGVTVKMFGVAFAVMAKTVAIGIGAIKLMGVVAVAMISPIGLIVAAVGAMGAYLVYATGVGGDALKWLGEKFDFLADDARDAYKGISEALKSGDIGKAANILWLTLKLEWTRGSNELKKIWGAMWFSIQSAQEDAIHWTTQKIIDMIFLADKAKNHTDSFLADLATTAKMMAVEAAIKLNPNFSPEQKKEAIIKNRADHFPEFSKTEQEKIRALDAANQAHVTALDMANEVHLGKKQKLDEEFISSIAAIEQELQDAKDALRNAVKDAVDKNKNKSDDDKPPELKPPAELLDGLKNALGGLTAIKQSFEVKGGFRVSQAEFGSASGSALSQIASSTSRTAVASEEIAENTKNSFPTYTQDFFMAITCTELMASRSGTKGESIDLVYVVRNTADYDAVVAAVEATAPASFSGLFRQNPKVVPEFVDTAQPDTGLWRVTVPYRSPSYTKLQKTVPVGSRRIDIDTTGGTRHITQGVGPSNGVVWKFPTEISDLNGAIGDDGTGKVAGVDVAAPACHLTVTDVRSSVTATYLSTCFNRQDCVNEGTLILSDDKRSFSFDTGEALYLGYTMRDRDDGVELVHQFDCMPNQDSAVIGGITVPEKKAFDYLWFQYQLQTDGSRYFTAPVAAFINQVYLRKDLSLLGLGTQL